MNIDLTGRVALITGATSELGRVISRTLADCGANVVIHYHSASTRAQHLAKEIQCMGRRTCLIKADITQETDIRRMRNEVQRQLGLPDIIITNAVVQYRWTSVLQQSPADYRSQFESCVLQNVLMAQAFLPAMIERRWGRIIALNSECAMQLLPKQSAYVSGKRGMDGILRVLAREVGDSNITVNQVAPGWMVSESRPSEGRPVGYLKSIPLRRWGQASDVANAIAFLASDRASFITGAYLPVCGGNVMPAI